MSYSPSLNISLALLAWLALTLSIFDISASASETDLSGEQGIYSFVQELRSRNLLLPVDTDPEQWKNSFFASRGDRLHEAVDMMVPRNTPIRAVEDGVIARLSWNAKGGNTIYQKDPSGRFTYYYAHLERYEEGIKTGDPVSRGQVIGYVGTTGNAPSNAPHLHFSITVSESSKYLSQGKAINPYDVFSSSPFVTASNSIPVAPARELNAGYHTTPNGLLAPPLRSANYRPKSLGSSDAGPRRSPSNGGSTSNYSGSPALTSQFKRTLLRMIQSSVRHLALD